MSDTDNHSSSTRYSSARTIHQRINTVLTNVKHQMMSSAFQAANELRTSGLYVLRGQRSGRIYRIASSKSSYQASAPGEPPAVRTGMFRNSWTTNTKILNQAKTYIVCASIENRLRVGNYLLGELLQNGTSRMKARPYKNEIQKRALPNINRIFNELQS